MAWTAPLRKHPRIGIAVAGAVLLLIAWGVVVGAQRAGGAAPASDQTERFTLWSLFWQSADLFTVLLVGGSVYAAAVIVRCVMEVRTPNILPVESEEAIRRHVEAGRFGELHRFVAEDDAFVSRVVRAALEHPGDDRNGVREAAELAASEQCARWFRMIEPLNIVGHLGPLLGLAGTVWGMIIAFASLGETGGQAGPADLSLGISKALFHTLLGLLLAVPALTVFGFYRSFIDKACNRAMIASSELVELLPEDAASRNGSG